MCVNHLTLANYSLQTEIAANLWTAAYIYLYIYIHTSHSIAVTAKIYIYVHTSLHMYKSHPFFPLICFECSAPLPLLYTHTHTHTHTETLTDISLLACVSKLTVLSPLDLDGRREPKCPLNDNILLVRVLGCYWDRLIAFCFLTQIRCNVIGIM